MRRKSSSYVRKTNSLRTMDFVPRTRQIGDPQPEIRPEFGRAPEVGTRKTFTPGCWEQTGAGDPGTYRPKAETCRVTGEVIQINQKHHFYRVRYETATGTQHECFKF